MSKLFVTGISTDVGKTITSAILVETLEADYWKPIQAGDLEHSDTHKVRRLITNEKSKFHANSFSLNTPMSPHAAADIDAVTISLEAIEEPKTPNHLIIEGAGGILVPLNNEKTILDLVRPDYKVIVVSRHYLGSINHTLLTLEMLKTKNLPMALIWSGDENKSTEEIILKMSGIPAIGRISDEPYFDNNVISEYAENWRDDKIFNEFVLD